MNNQADIRAVITAQDQGASRTISGVSNALGGVHNTLKQIISTAIGFNVAQLFAQATYEVKNFVTGSVKAYEQQQNALVQIDAALRSTHRAAGLYKQDLVDQAQALQRVTPYADEAINSTQALLLTFTNIKGKVYQQALPAILDLSTAMHQDLQSSAVEVGKALNDPVLGLTALHRIGVTFSEKQKELIKHFADTNQLGKAQGVIIAELNKEFGGSATAAAKTYQGRIQQLKNEFNNFQENVGQKVLAVLFQLGSRFLTMLPSIERITNQIATYLKPSFEALWHTLQDKVFPMLTKLWKEVIVPLTPVIGTILVVALKKAVDATNLLLAAITPLMNFLIDHKWIIEVVIGAFLALKASMMLGAAFDAIKVGVATLRLVTFPSLISSISAISASWAAAFPIAGILADIALVTKAVSTVRDAINATKEASKSASGAADARKQEYSTLTNLEKHGTAAQKLRASTLLRSEFGGGFAIGGYTGRGSANDIAGVVHRGEYVVPRSQVDQSTGIPKTGHTIVNISVNAQAFMGSQLQARQFARQIFGALQDYATSKNTTVARMIA